MTQQDRAEAFRYIESQLNSGYIDLGAHDEDELEIVKEAIQALKMVDAFCNIGCTSFRLTPEEVKKFWRDKKMYSTFTKEPLHIDDVVVYLKNERTGSNTIRKCKFIGQVTGFTNTKVEIHRLSSPDTFVTPDEIQDLCTDTVCSDDVVYIIISKYQEDSHTRTLKALGKIIYEKNEDIYQLIGKWFCALEDEGVNPWMNEECIDVANKHYYTEADYKRYLRTLV